MRTIKSKVFDVLTDRISINQFENWLYDSEEVLDNINKNNLYFDVIAINYRSTSWRADLEVISLNAFSAEFLEIVKINYVCNAILESQTFNDIYIILSKLIKDFNYGTDYSILWELLRLKDYFDFVKEGLITAGSLDKQTKFYADQALKIISNGKDYKDIKQALELSLVEYI